MSDWLTEYFRPRPKPASDSATNTPARVDLSRVVPVPASSSTAPTPRPESRSSFSSDVEDLSIGLGRGFTSQLEGLKTLVTEPRQVYEGLKEFAGQVVDDPSVLAEMAKEYGIKATSGPMGFGEVMGEFISPIPRTRVPTTQIVKPKGNINLAPVIRAESLKGPEKQTLESFKSQAARLPGVTQGGFAEEVMPLINALPESSAKSPITKEQFENLVPPSEYGKVDLRAGASDAYQHYIDEAADTLSNNYEDVVRATMERLGLNYDSAKQYQQYVDFFNGSMNVDRSFMEAMRRHGVTDAQRLQGLEDEVFSDLAAIHARDMLNEDFGGRIGQYAYGGYQRLMATPSADDPGYFEVGVTHPSARVGEYRHYSESSDPLIGHIRGTYLKPGMPEESYEVIHDWAAGRSSRGILDIFKAKPNSVIIEELQSDVQKGDFEQKGALRQVHGTLFKAAVQDALERGVDTIYMPTSIPIAAVRGAMPAKYSSIYDQQVVKEGLNPLKKIPGVSVNPIEHNGKTTYYELSFTPEAKEYILRGPGQTAPGYCEGGMVTKPGRMYAEGGKVDKKKAELYDEDAIEARAEEIREKLFGAIRSGKAKVAGMAGISGMKRKAEQIPLQYFGRETEGGGEADAMRHMLFQAQLAKKYGDLPADIISTLYEYTSPGQTGAEREMDFFNDALGREIAKQASDEQQMIELARKYVEDRRARVLPKEQRTGY